MTNEQATHSKVVLERTLDAPPELVWQMWTDPEHFRRWYGPEGAAIPEASMDVRVGGRRFVAMTAEVPGGSRRMWFTGEHVEVVEHTRLVYTESMADEDGTMLSPADLGMPGDHPATTEVTVELTDLGGRTRLVLTHVGIAEGSPGAIGWTMALDKLAARLAAPAG